MTTAKDRARATAALVPTCRQLVTLHKSGHRGRQWQAAFGRLSVLLDLIEPKGTPDA